jgi:hypothetical protein
VVRTQTLEQHNITCRALQLALAALQIRTAWHAELIDAETAMESLDAAVRGISRCQANREHL